MPVPVPMGHASPDDVRFLHDTMIGVAIPAGILVLHASLKLLAHATRRRRFAPWRERMRRGAAREPGVVVLKLFFERADDRLGFTHDKRRVTLREGVPIEGQGIEAGHFRWVLGMMPAGLSDRPRMDGEPFRSPSAPDHVDLEPFGGRYETFVELPGSKPTAWFAVLAHYSFLAVLTLDAIACRIAEPAPDPLGAAFAVAWMFLMPLAIILTLAAQPLREL